MLDLAGPLAVFQTAGSSASSAIDAEQGNPAYRVFAVSEQGGLVMSSCGIEVMTRPWQELVLNTVIVPGGRGAREGVVSAPMLHYLRDARAQRQRLASVCTGAFVLATAGVLNGLHATTHWRHAASLQRQYPDIKVDIDKIFTRDGGVWTSAGITAGIDLALAMVEADLGAAVAARTAREMVVYHRRAGGQSQFSALQDMTPQSERMRDVLSYIRANLSRALSIEHLAEVACISPRQFCRAFKTETGQTPAKAVERIRAEAARPHIENGDNGIEAVARLVGFEDAERMRRAFVRVYGQPPQALRRLARGAQAEH